MVEGIIDVVKVNVGVDVVKEVVWVVLEIVEDFFDEDEYIEYVEFLICFVLLVV